jgi:hypothetical protein
MKTNIDFRKLIPIIQVFGLIGIFLLGQNLYAQGSNMKPNPDVHIKVDKKTDEKGNIIQYDSTYSYSWSGSRHNNASLDSILNEFRNSHDPFHFFGTNPFTFSDPAFSFDFNQSDSSFFESPFNFHFDNLNDSTFFKINELMKHHEAMMDRFFKIHQFNDKPILKSPVNPDQQNKATPKKESLNQEIEL